MTPEKFRSIVMNIVNPRNPRLSSFGEGDLRDLSRGYSREEITMDDAINKLRRIYRENKQITDDDFEAIEKILKKS